MPDRWRAIAFRYAAAFGVYAVVPRSWGLAANVGLPLLAFLVLILAEGAPDA